MNYYFWGASGVCTLLKEDREWSIKFHCFNYWPGLSMKDAFELDSEFKSVKSKKNSSRIQVKRLLKAAAVSLDMTCVQLVKAHGTSFKTTNIDQSKL